MPIGLFTLQTAAEQKIHLEREALSGYLCDGNYAAFSRLADVQQQPAF